MRVIWNGTGAAWSYHLGNASAIVETDGLRILIDCGHTVPARLQQMHLAFNDIDAVVITHLHGDHIYGLEEWGFRNFLIWNRRPPLLIAHPLVDPLWHHVLSGTMGQNDQKRQLGDYFQVIPLQENAPLPFGPVTIEVHPVLHVPGVPAYGIKLQGPDATIAFTGDTQAEGNPFFYNDVDLTFHDCSFLPPYPNTVHAHFEELQRYPREWRQKTYLTHYEDAVQQWRTDPQWRAMVEQTGMRLAEPFTPIEVIHTP
ncbi:MAG: MBL fold metallo-hydrolase [Chloroherpetonaceae bacterium]|nr:MBL fold metallo-hydrolase [Chloroherpetonaceae bacterium]